MTSLVHEGKTYTVSAHADCCSYSSYQGWYGLTSKEGKVITPPIYDSIEAIGRGVYL